MTSGELPALMVFNMTLVEYRTHAWDLAVAEGARSFGAGGSHPAASIFCTACRVTPISRAMSAWE